MDRIYGIMWTDGYWQTWPLASRIRRWPLVGPHLYSAAQGICELLCGHERSKTEWGYGGGEQADIWCRWCNKVGSIPLSELRTAFPNARTVIWRATSCDIAQTTWTKP